MTLCVAHLEDGDETASIYIFEIGRAQVQSVVHQNFIYSFIKKELFPLKNYVFHFE